ncbi:MAG: alpha/beta fold hydrolase [Euryarchaeota archaeon]|nr:alpha/beta fold hydrolase [Euryarchaeota archaeon]
MKRVEWSVHGDVVRGALFTPPGKIPRPLPLVLLIHGLSSSRVEFYDFPEKLAASGLAVLSFSYRGHGDSDGERGILSKERVREDCEGALEAMRSEYGVDLERVALVGHSTGGTLAICTAPHLPNVKCVVAMAPVARLKDEMNTFEFAGYNFMRALNGPARLFSKTGLKVPYKVDYHRLYASRAAVERAEKDGFLQELIPVKNYKPLVRDLDGVACAGNLRLPTFVLVAQYDIVVGKYNSRRVFDALPGPKKFVEVPRSGHSMVGDARSDFVAAHVNEFLAEHLKGAAA